MQVEFLGQLERLKGVLGEEKQELQAQVQLLQQELEDVNRSSEADHKLQHRMVTQARETETRLRQQVQDLTSQLQEAKAMEIKLYDSMQELKANMQDEKQKVG